MTATHQTSPEQEPEMSETRDQTLDLRSKETLSDRDR